MSYTIPCNNCCYCKTGEIQYCMYPRKVEAPYSIPCNICCYCKTGEVQYCTNPIKLVTNNDSK